MEVRVEGEGGQLLEREPELGAMERAAVRAIGGDGSVLVVEGPAGIGKSELLDAFTGVGEEHGMTLLRARAGRLESEFSYGVVLQLLAGQVYSGDHEAASGGGDPFAGAAAAAKALFEGEAQYGSRLSGDASFSLLHGLYWLLSDLSERGSLIVCVDDVHWADAPSLGFLNFLAQRIEDLPVLLVLTRRTGEPSEDDELLAELAEAAGSQTLRPAPLSGEATASRVRRNMPDAEDEFCDACWRMTRGNPLYLRELLAAVRNDGLLPEADQAGAVASLSPESISRTVVARLARLPAQARALAEAVAVRGDNSALGSTASLAGIEGSDAVEAADMLAAAEILEPGEKLSFVHPIVAAAVYAGIPPARRSKAHLDVATKLERSGAAPEAVASHLLRAEHGEQEWVWASLRRAAERARARGVQAAALRYLERALAEQPPSEVRGELLALRGLAEAETGDPHGGEMLGEAVEMIAAPRSRAQALFDLAMVLSHGGAYSRATDAAARGLRELGDVRDPKLEGELRSVRHMSATWVDLTDAEATRGRLQEAVSEPGLEDSPAGRAVIANSAVGLAFAEANQATIHSLARRAFSVPQPTDDPFDRVAFPLIGLAMTYAGDLSAAEEASSAAVEAARKHGSILDLGAASQVRAVARFEAGRVSESLADAKTAVEAGRWGWGATLPMAHAYTILASIERGDLESAESALELSGGEERWQANISYGLFLLSRAELLRARGQKDEALELLMFVGQLTKLANATAPVVSPWRPPAVILLLERGERERALDLAEEGHAIASAFGAPRPIGVALRGLGLATGGDRGLELLAESVAVLREPEARLQLAHSLVALGSAQRRAGRKTDARKTLREGLDEAHSCGAQALADTAAEELRVAGGRPRRRALRGVESLTPSELRTARMAAAGLGNREIAERLFVSRRTVEMHLSSSYAKLEIPSREGLAEALGEAASGGE